jgi:NNP family nitrate/nitrite transporter-like MFS transporter
MDAGNGATYALVPHVHPYANGIVSGIVGAVGNFGGVIGAIIFRYMGTEYNKGIYILGFIAVALHLTVCWIPPIPKGQVGGR